MKLNKTKIAKLTDNEAHAIQGGAGRTVNSTNNNFTCCWCTGGGNTTNESQEPTCVTYTDPTVTR